MKKQILQVGNLMSRANRSNPNQGRVYLVDGLCPALNCMQGGGLQPYIVEIKELKNRLSQVIGGLSDAIWGHQFHQQDRVYDIADVAQCISAQIPGGGYKILEMKKCVAMRTRSDGKWVKGEEHMPNLEINNDDVVNSITTVQKDNMVLEADCIQMVRNEKGKELRKQYEAGEIELSWAEQKEPRLREDGCSNTITSVQKDNYVLVKQATKDGAIACNLPGGWTYCIQRAKHEGEG